MTSSSVELADKFDQENNDITSQCNYIRDAFAISGRQQQPKPLSHANTPATTALVPSPVRQEKSSEQPFDSSASMRQSTATTIDNGTSLAKDCSHAVDNFFGSVRVPASFLVATSFSEIFGIAANKNNYNDESDIQRQLQLICLLFQGLSFVLSVHVIFLCTSALVRSLTNNFDPYAENGYEFLFREFHFEFVCVQWSFQVSLFGFLMAVTAKILYGFELFNTQSEHYDQKHWQLGIGVCLVMFSLMIHLFSYMNSTLVGWNSMLGMTWDLITMLMRRSIDGGRWAEQFSLLMAIVGLIFLGLALIPGL